MFHVKHEPGNRPRRRYHGRMSFTVKAAGTREECLDQLNGDVHQRLSGDGQIVRGLLLAFVADAPSVWGDETPIKYDISAYGHHADDASTAGVPSLSISLSVKPART
jgi:hypothetical protein